MEKRSFRMGIIVPADIYVSGCPLNVKLWLMAFFNFKKNQKMKCY